MNKQIDEQLSALADGELERDQMRFLLRSVAVDPALPLRWERYHVARQALRRQETFVLRPGFAAAVMQQLAQEPALRARGGQWLRWGTGGAIAASVAVAALVLTRPAEAPTSLATRNPVAASPRIRRFQYDGSATTSHARHCAGRRPSCCGPVSPRR
jgi:sigma-E factor negative regulatory protein RseA